MHLSGKRRLQLSKLWQCCVFVCALLTQAGGSTSQAVLGLSERHRQAFLQITCLQLISEHLPAQVCLLRTTSFMILVGGLDLLCRCRSLGLSGELADMIGYRSMNGVQ